MEVVEVEEDLEVVASVEETLTALLTPPTAPSLVTADLRLVTPMVAMAPQLTLTQAILIKLIN